MRIIFSSLFRQELQKETLRYADILLRLGEDFTERVKAAFKPPRAGMEAIMWDRTASRADAVARFLIWSTTKSTAIRFTFSVWSTKGGTPIF